MEDKKREYLIKTFSRTKRKDYENYIINGIWHKLNRTDIQPITQQYVKRSDGKYALIDLYFPQINFGVEIDEEYHIKNTERDLIREMTMEQVLGSYEETKDFSLFRVKASDNLNNINSQINEVIKIIEQRAIEYNIDKWDFYRKPYELPIKKKLISVKDNLLFDRIEDICYCFGKDKYKIQRAFFPLGYGYHFWSPILAIESKGILKSVSNGWINTLSDDWNTMKETNDDKSKITINNPKYYPKEERVAFAKSKDALGRDKYRFIGVFKMNMEESREGKFIIYNRIAEELDLSIFLNDDSFVRKVLSELH